MLRQGSVSSHPHVALAISTTTAGASALSWATNNSAWFTVGAALFAMLSGCAGFFFYMVSTYYKIKSGGKQ